MSAQHLQNQCENEYVRVWITKKSLCFPVYGLDTSVTNANSDAEQFGVGLVVVVVDIELIGSTARANHHPTTMPFINHPHK